MKYILLLAFLVPTYLFADAVFTCCNCNLVSIIDSERVCRASKKCMNGETKPCTEKMSFEEKGNACDRWCRSVGYVAGTFKGCAMKFGVDDSCQKLLPQNGSYGDVMDIDGFQHEEVSEFSEEPTDFSVHMDESVY